MKTLKEKKYGPFRGWRILVICGVLCAGMTGCGSREAEFLEENTATELQSFTPTIQPEKAEIYVDVCGAVASPGVFALPEGSRVFQAIEAAGGFLPEADVNCVNRALGLADGQKVYVPTMEETEGSSPEEGILTDGESSLQGEEVRIDLNTADEAALCNLSGIGASKAKAIIAYREANGPFSSVEELMNVEGIKEGTFLKIKDQIIVR